MVVVILNNFPFDLSNVKVDEEEKENKKGKWTKGGGPEKKEVNVQGKATDDKGDGVEKVIPMAVEGTQLFPIVVDHYF